MDAQARRYYFGSHGPTPQFRPPSHPCIDDPSLSEQGLSTGHEGYAEIRAMSRIYITLDYSEIYLLTAPGNRQFLVGNYCLLNIAYYLMNTLYLSVAKPFTASRKYLLALLSRGAAEMARLLPLYFTVIPSAMLYAGNRIERPQQVFDVKP